MANHTWRLGDFAIKAAVDLGVVKPDDVVAVVLGSPDEAGTDVLRLVRIR